MAEKLFFYKGQEDILTKVISQKEEKPVEKIRESFSKVLDGKNLSFLLGSGCSSLMKDGIDIGIPTMMPLAKEFFDNVLKKEDIKWLKDELKLDVSTQQFSNNLEHFLGGQKL